jgi:hypothetical protein
MSGGWQSWGEAYTDDGVNGNVKRMAEIPAALAAVQFLAYLMF